MKSLIYMLFLCFSTALLAQAEKAELPEPSEPPFEVGALPLDSGHTIKRADAPDLNFRIVENKMRLYWIDDEGLVIEPEVAAATLRFEKSAIPPLPKDVRSYHHLKRLSDDTALGAPYYLRFPHHYYVTLVIQLPDSDKLESFRFRYTPSMDKVAAKPKE